MTTDELANLVREVGLQVSAAQDRADDRAFIAETHGRVNDLNASYRDVLKDMSEGDKMKLERQLGRRLIDIRRLAALLPKVGVMADVSSTPDRRVLGVSEVGERRITGVSWGAGSSAKVAPTNVLRVGGDIEAWCGPCNELTTHTIEALVGQEPKRVACGACNQRHNYRTTPARTKTEEATSDGAVSTAGSFSRGKDGDNKREDESKKLARELALLETTRLWNPADRYKMGEVITHPDFGRGRIETVLRGSVLVRFPSSGGLKSLILNT